MQYQICRKFSQVVTMEGAYKKDGRHLSPNDLSIIADGSIVIDDSNRKIVWVGRDHDLPAEYQKLPASFHENTIVLPEIVDSHTHLIFGGNRAFEYGMRLNGASYEELAAAGGGILHTMEKTQKLNFAEMVELGKTRIETIASYGVGTIEVKSGYGLTTDSEREIIKAIHALKTHFKGRVQIFCTYMAAHAVPKSFKNSAEYMDQVVLPLLEELAPTGMIDAVDIFHEQNYFTNQDVKKLFTKAKSLNIPCKTHADEFNNNHGAKLAAEHGAFSADHLLAVDEEGALALARSSTVATLLPGTGLFLGKKQADARMLLKSGAKVAMASDYNPGSCHCDNLLLISSLAAPLYKLNLGELWGAITLNAAHALGMKKQGAIVPGMSARLAVFKAKSLEEISYNWGKNLFSYFL